MIRPYALCLIGLSLSACGGSQTSEEIAFVTIGPATVGTGDALPAVSRDPVSGVVTITPVGQTDAIELVPNSIFDAAGFEGLFAADNEDIYLRKSTDGGAVALYSSFRRANSFSGTIITRQSDTRLPTTGSAKWTGEYLGLEIYPEIDRAGFAIFGTVTLEADFGTTTIGGDITERVSVRTDGLIPDLVLEDTPILTGGSAIGASVEDAVGESTGSFSVLIAGPDANAVVGQISMPYSESFQELGVFIAE